MIDNETKKAIQVEVATQIRTLIKQGERVPFDKEQEVPVSAENILRLISHHLVVPIEELKSKCRRRDLNDIRHIYCQLTEMFCNLSLAKVGALIGRDHATVLHSRRKAQELFDTDSRFKKTYNKMYVIIKEIKDTTELDYLNNHPQL